MNKPRVSVIVSHRCSDHDSEDTLNAILTQSYHDVEILVLMHDTDEPCSCLRALSSHPKIRAISTEGKSPAEAHNLGVENATGNFICVLHRDDKVAATYLEKAINSFNNDSTIALIVSWVEILGEENQIWKLDNPDLVALLCERIVYGAPLVRKSAFQAVGGYDEQIPDPGFNDWDLWVTLIERGFRVSIVPEVLTHCCKHADSPSLIDKNPEKYLKTVQYLIAKHGESFRKHLFDVLLRREGETCDLLKAGYAIERDLATSLEPVLKSKKQELERLKQKLNAVNASPSAVETFVVSSDANQVHVQELEAALRDAQREIRGLRDSISWRMTAPLRVFYDFLFGQR